MILCLCFYFVSALVNEDEVHFNLEEEVNGDKNKEVNQGVNKGQLNKNHDEGNSHNRTSILLPEDEDSNKKNIFVRLFGNGIGCNHGDDSSNTTSIHLPEDSENKNIFVQLFGSGTGTGTVCKPADLSSNSLFNKFELDKEIFNARLWEKENGPFTPSQLERNREELAQRLFEKVSKILVESVNAESKITVEQFAYVVNFFRLTGYEDMNQRIRSKFYENTSFLEMIIRDKEEVPSNDYSSLSTLDSNQNRSSTSNQTSSSVSNQISSITSNLFSPFTPTTYEELNNEIKRNSEALNTLASIQEESEERESQLDEREKLLEEKQYLLDQKRKHFNSILDIAKNTPIHDVDVDKLHSDIKDLENNVKTLIEKSKDIKPLEESSTNILGESSRNTLGESSRNS